MGKLGFLNEKNIINRRCGFIAHHTIRHLLQNTDCEIVSLDRLDYSGNLNRIADMMNEFDKETQKEIKNSLPRFTSRGKRNVNSRFR